jgi:arylformamidase
VLVNFSKLPGARLPQVVRQVRRALEWVYRNAASFGGDPEAIYLSAHSSGAHLSSLALAGYGASRAVPPDFIKGATLVSGPYYLQPVVLSARSSWVQLSPEEVWELSPGVCAERLHCPVIVAYAQHDTDEFQRQSRDFGAALERAGRLQQIIRFPGLNHFELPEKFGDPTHGLVRAVLGQMQKEKTWQQS